MANKYSTSKQVIILAVMGLAVGLFLLLKGIIGVTSNSVSFTRYDDALKLFSIDYPSNFYVVSRKIENSMISVDFRPTGGESSEFLSVMAYPKQPDVYFTKSNIKLREAVGDPNIELEKYYPARGDVDDGHYFLFRPTENDNNPYKIYIYDESENNVAIQVMYFINGDPKYDHSVLEHIFSSLAWSPVEIVKQFQ